MFKKSLILGATLLISNLAFADIICKAKTSQGDDVTVTVRLVSNNPVSARSVEIEAPFSNSKKVYRKVAQTDDGHRILISAPGLMVDVSAVYGCFRNATVISDVSGYGVRFLEPLTIATCSGGTSSDSICGAP